MAHISQDEDLSAQIRPIKPGNVLVECDGNLKTVVEEIGDKYQLSLQDQNWW